VGDDGLAGNERNALYRVGFDGTIQDQEGYCAIGGTVDSLQAHLAANYRPGLSIRDALRLGRDTLQRAENGQPALASEKLEVAILDRTCSGRRFRRLAPAEIREHLNR
jgi:proteasome alpha subunit